MGQIDELKRFILDEEAATITEYAIVIGAIGLAAAAIIALFRLVAAKIQEGSAWFQ